MTGSPGGPASRRAGRWPAVIPARKSPSGARVPERGEELRFVRAGERRIEHRILETLDGSTKNDSSAVDSGGASIPAAPGRVDSGAGGTPSPCPGRWDRASGSCPGPRWSSAPWPVQRFPLTPRTRLHDRDFAATPAARASNPCGSWDVRGLGGHCRGQSLPGPASVPACYAGSASTSLDPAPAMAVVEVRRHPLTADGFARMGEAGTFAGGDRGELEKVFGDRP